MRRVTIQVAASVCLIAASALLAPTGASAKTSPVDGRIIIADVKAWSVTKYGNHPRRVWWYGDEMFSLAWSPDGSQLAYVKPVDQKDCIFIMQASTFRSHRFACNSGQPRWPSWSPNGRRIVYAQGAGTSTALYVKPINGGPARRITPKNGSGDPSWGPSGRIVFDRKVQVAGPVHLFVVRADGSHRHRITTGSTLDLAPNWSPSGSGIVFIRLPTAGADATLWTIHPDGSGATEIPTPAVPAFPRWSPAGDRIMYSGTLDSAGDLCTCTIAPNGTHQRQIAYDRGPVGWMPRRSPWD